MVGNGGSQWLFGGALHLFPGRTLKMTSSPASGRSERQPSPFDSLPDALVGEVLMFVDFEER